MIFKSEACYRITDYLVKGMLYDLVTDRYRFLDGAVENIRQVLNRVFRDQAVSEHLESIQEFDGYTFDHSLRVAVLSVLCGISLDLKMKQLKEICTGALLHDVGKILLSKTILDKPAKLTPEEFEHLKLHSRIGFDMIKDKGFGDPVGEIVLQHHERFDGLGYPQGLAGKQTNLLARIVALADSFEALTSGRIYRGASPVTETIETIRKSAGFQYDPEITEAFLASVGDLQSAAGSNILDRLYSVTV